MYENCFCFALLTKVLGPDSRGKSQLAIGFLRNIGMDYPQQGEVWNKLMVKKFVLDIFMYHTEQFLSD